MASQTTTDSSPVVDGATTVAASVKKWAAQPFTTTMDLWHWFLWTGLIVVAVILWLLILHDLKGEL